MDFLLNDEQKMLRQVVADFAKKEIAPKVPFMEKEKYIPRDLIQAMRDLGLFGIAVDQSYGGSGMDFMSNVIVIHELSKVSAALGVLLSVHTSVGTKPILQFGSEKQKDLFVTKLATGEYIGAFALTESHAGSDASNIKMRAKKEGAHYILNGSKVFITNGLEADTFIVFARTNDQVRSKGISAFIVPKDTPGLSIGKSEKKMGLHGASTVTLTFDMCKVNHDLMLGNEGEGFKVAMANLQTGRIGIAAQALGIAEGACQLAIQYAKERKQFGKALYEHQAIAFKIANMQTKIEAAKLLVYQAAYDVDHNKSSLQGTSMAKLFASETAMNVAIEAVQVLGGYGYTEDYEAERYFRDAKVTQIYEGTSEIQKVVISKQLLEK